MSSFSVIGITPFHRPDPRLALALARAGAGAVLDLGRDRSRGLAALDTLVRRLPRARATAEHIGPLGVRVHRAAPFGPRDLPECIEIVLVDAGTDPAPWRNAAGVREVWAEVASLAEASAAVALGVDALVAAGHERGGRVGADSSFVLLQRLLDAVELPIFVHGGIGPATAAACAAGGAAGVVLDEQLALVRESQISGVLRDVLATLDGSETVLIGDQRVFTRPDLAPVQELAEAAAEDVEAALGDDPKRQLVPLGQAAFLARPLAERHGSAAGVVRAIERALTDHLDAAHRHDVLGPDAPLAREHGTRYPILQGPMTRVSDRATFADAVAVGGGLPFLALALMRGPQVAELVRETAERLGDRAWGVGILGFVPPELRDEQMKALESAAPPFAIIAGGRPSQAKGLEERGTRAYLHVPSPGLLELFLKEGGRRFIFEGRECGGHVGPRSSFPLWEAQLAVLERFAKPEELSIVFAGGIHDARSGAMVGAMAAPLAARGAKIGVLMGTAYLFTEEAVQSGAILPAYQRMAIECRETALLETAPGHSTRCVETDFVRTFVSEKQRLEAEGKAPREVWAELEQLNLGRLRLASKGRRRQGAELVDVDEDEQVREGMYMIGQVASMRSRVTTVEELHREVSVGAAGRLAELETERVDVADPEARPVDIAVVGMSCVFPGAKDLKSYWANIVGGVDSVREVDGSRWSAETYFDPEGRPGRTTPSKWGGFLDPIVFDPGQYGIPPKSLTSIEAVQLLSLEVARRALVDAGYGTREFDRDRTAVVFGAEAGTELAGGYGFRAMFPQMLGKLPQTLEDSLPVLTEDSFPGVLANVIAGRIANRLDLGGMNFTVDAACASSLAAVEVAVQSLLAGTSDMVLAGGADTHNSINDFLLFSSVHALSRQGRCRSFDSNADGIALGEGVGVVVLKRLADAERDGDRIYAVIKGIAGTSDGKSLGLTAPRKDGQVRALERAWQQSGLDPSRIGLMEAHGTGTVVGDRTELDSMQTVFERAAPQSCALGSVKSQIGHTKCAAGVASLIKIALCVQRGVRPPSLHVDEPNPGWKAATSPFFFLDHAQPWAGMQRLAAVSAFGFGGTNFHAVIGSHEGLDDPTPLEVWPAELFLFRGTDREQAAKHMELVQVRLAEEDPYDLAALARAAANASQGPVQVALIAHDADDLAQKLAAARRFESDGREVFVRAEGALDDIGQVAFLFPGQGSQRVGMLGDLFVAFPELQEWLAQGENVAQRIYTPRSFDKESAAAREEALKDTRAAQPALGLVDIAMFRVLRRLGLAPDMLAGHSYGELAALCAAGALRCEDLLELSEHRAQEILRAAGDDPGTMAAVSAAAEDVQPVLADFEDVVLANHNAPRQTVISGPTASVEAALARLAEVGLSTRKLPVACAFHSGVVAGAQEGFARVLDRVSVEGPRIPVFANKSAERYPQDPASVRRLLAEQIANPVLFTREIEAMYAAGARVFVEVGPGRILSSLVQKILAGRDVLVVPTDAAPGTHGVVELLGALARLAVHGVAFDADALFHGRDVARFDLAQAPARTLPPLAWYLDGHRARPVKGELPEGAMRPLTKTPAEVAAELGGASGAVLVPSSEREASVVEYLRNLRQIAESQRQVMLSFLGTQPPPMDVAPIIDVPAVTDRPADVALAAHDGAAPSSSSSPSSNGAPRDITHTLLAIVSERTGYPVEMLGLDLDLEADLSIDSIKRIEILGALNETLGGVAPEGQNMEAVVEELAQVKSLRGIIDWLETHAPTPAADAPAPAAPEPVSSTNGSPAAAGQDMGETLLAIVSERTGYPVEMLGLDLDLEADLSIDSIKRIEILGALNESAGGLTSGEGEMEAVVEELAQIKTLRGIIDWLEAHARGETRAEAPAVAPVAEAKVAAADDALPELPISRYVLRVVELPEAPTNGRSLSGRKVALTDDRIGVADALSKRLEEAGACVVRVQSGEGDDVGSGTDLESIDVLIHLAPLVPAAGTEAVKALFELSQQAVKCGATAVLGVTGMGGEFGHRSRPKERTASGAGVAGLLKSLAKERPELHVRAIDLDPWEEPQKLAGQVMRELLATDDHIEVGYRGDRRRVLRIERADLEPLDHQLELDRDSVVLVTGGARGITARIALDLARRHGSHFELVGRSPLPAAREPDAELDAAQDPLVLKRLLAQRGAARTPAELETLARRILAEREIAANLAAIENAGGSVRYHSVDVRDRDAFGRLIDSLYEEHGRIDGVIHGAGVIEDKLLVDKTRGSFDRVFDTKVRGALTLAEKLRADVRFVVFFSSVSSAFGNRGQTDYAAANDLLDKLAHELNERLDGRVVSVNWGPWDSTGMVSPELRREYARRGIGLIPLQAGSERLLDELCANGKAESQVILMSAEPNAMS